MLVSMAMAVAVAVSVGVAAPTWAAAAQGVAVVAASLLQHQQPVRAESE